MLKIFKQCSKYWRSEIGEIGEIKTCESSRGRWKDICNSRVAFLTENEHDLDNVIIKMSNQLIQESNNETFCH